MGWFFLGLYIAALSFVLGALTGMVIMRHPDDPLSVDRLNQRNPDPRPYLPTDSEEPVYELPGWDLPG